MKVTKLSLFAAFAICLFFTGCSDVNVDKVKSGSLDGFKGLPIGQVFDNYKYFKSKRWKSIKTDDGRNVVEFNGVLELNDARKKAGIKEVSVLFQFIVLKNGAFVLAYIESRTLDSTGKTETIDMTSRSSSLLSEIFANTMLTVPESGI